MLLAKKDIDILLGAGFDESDLGLVEGGKRGIELYEGPNNYCARELIENACEQGECDLHDDIITPTSHREPYDNSRKGLWDDIEYAGNEDPLEDVAADLRPQVEFLLGIRAGRISIWQKREEGNKYKWPVKNLKVVIPEEEKERTQGMKVVYQRELWLQYARDEWKKCWQAAVDSMWEFPIDDFFKIRTSKNKELDILVLDADNLREIGYKNLPAEARWITMIYFIKGNAKRPVILSRTGM